MPFAKPIYAVAGYKTVFMGPGRPEFKPEDSAASFETIIKETADGTMAQVPHRHIDEGVIGSFMAARFINQANLPGFLPFMVPELLYKPCFGVEGACGTGGRAIGVAIRSLLSGLADTVFVSAFEIQNTMKALYGADVLAGAAYYNGERKEGEAFFFPGIFSNRAVQYMEKYGKEKTREALATWYENAIIHARSDAKAQEHFNKTTDLKTLGMTPPNPKTFLPGLNPYDCSKVSDGAASLILATEAGLKKLGVEPILEIIGLGEAEGDITARPKDPTRMDTTEAATKKAFQSASLKPSDIHRYEVHDCFTISGLLSLEAIGLANPGEGPDYILSKKSFDKVNLSGGLIGFGHPTGASGVRMLVDLIHDEKTKNGMMISMGGNDKTVTAIITKRVT